MKGGPVYHSVLALLIGVVTFSGGHSYLPAPAPPTSSVKVTVFYETLCGDTINFFRNELEPLHQMLGRTMDLEFVPFGKAISRPYINASSMLVSFENVCQHGANECLGNRVMACAKNMLIQDMATQTKFTFCAMSRLNPLYKETDPSQMLPVFSACARQYSITWETMINCANTHEGRIHLHMNGVKTLELNPRLDFVPTILIEGVVPAIQYMPKENCKTTLQEEVCKALGHRHPSCMQAIPLASPLQQAMPMVN